MVDKKCMLKGACYGCLQRGSARALQIQRQMLAANHWSGHGVLNGRLGGQTGGDEGVCSPMGRTMMLATQTPQVSQGLNNQVVHMVRAKSVAEECLVRHEWEERSLVL